MNGSRLAGFVLAVAVSHTATAAGTTNITANNTANETEDRIAVLEEQVETLRALVTDQQDQIRGLTTVAARTRAATSTSNAIVASTNGSVQSFTSTQGDYAFQIGGRVQVDQAWYDADDVPMGDGTQVRRMFLETRGVVYNDWSYRVQYDFARPASGDVGARGIRDAWIAYSGFEPALITVGNHKEPFGMERLASNLNTLFMERATTDSLFAADRHIGISAKSYGERWLAQVGIFGEDTDGDVGAEGDEGNDIAGRFVYAPVQEPGRLLHLGLAARLNDPKDSPFGLRFRSKPNVNISDVRLIDTGFVPDVDTLLSIGGEAAAIYGPLTFQAEYTQSQLERDASPDLAFDAWYVSGAWLLTGESRAYRMSEAVFDRIQPLGVFGTGGPGAWEIAARFGSADITDGGIIGGEQQDLTIGLNWYPAPNVRFTANYVHVLDVERPGTATDGETPNIFGVRAQMDF